MKILVTGVAGFIGMHVSRELLTRGHGVVGLDNLNNYYPVTLKESRLANLEHLNSFNFTKIDLADKPSLENLFQRHKFDAVVNLAAQAGVRYSLENPQAYIDSNIVGFMNLLECCRHHKIEHLVYASSSSVYGLNGKTPFSTHDNVDHPISLYAATKKSNELMAHTYSHLYGIPTTGLRFFTVYGPWGRPDMAYFLFTKAIIEGKAIQLFNNGDMLRDFTYIDDIVEGIMQVLDKPAKTNPDWLSEAPDPGTSPAPYRLFNIGNSNPVTLLDFVATIERALGKEAIREMMPMQPGDVAATYADIDQLVAQTGYRPSTPLEQGIGQFVDWYCDYFQ
ncbi:MAG: NAD-dependent epimerase [Halioglobus sp.]